MRTKYNPLAFIDILRIFGALIIAIIFHSVIDIFPQSGVFMFLKTYGRIFVEMFFIISGMSFFLFYYNKLYSEDLSYRSFAYKRFIRLYPIMTFSTIFMFIVSLIKFKTTGVGNINIFHFLTSLLFGSLDAFGGRSLNGNLWYVTVLLLCYLISCLIIFVSKRFQTRSTLLFSIPLLSGFLMYLMYRNKVVGIFWTDALPRGLICYFSGVYLGKFLRYFDNCNKKNEIRIISLIIFSVSMVLFLNKSIQSQSLKTDITLSFGLLLSISLIIVLYDLKSVNCILSNNIIKIMGAISFPIYVLNKPILLFLGETFLQSNPNIGAWTYFIILFSSHIAIGLIWYFGEKFIKTLLLKSRKNL